jgi:hypothetical protein
MKKIIEEARKEHNKIVWESDPKILIEKLLKFIE